MTLLLLLFICSGATFVALSIPLLLGRIPPNHWYGFRVPSTLKDPKTWYAANRYSGRLGLALGLVMVVSAIALYLVPGIGLESFAWSYLAVVAVGLSLFLFLSFRYLWALPK